MLFPLCVSLRRLLGRWRSCQVQRSLNAAFQDLLRLGKVGHGPRELERAQHEAEDGRRAATFRYGIGVRKQCGQRRHVASQPFFVVLPGGQGLAGDFREQRRRGAPACRVFKVSAVQVPPDRALEVQTSPLIFIEAMLLVGERACYRLTNELFLGLEMRRECLCVPKTLSVLMEQWNRLS